MNYEEEYNEGQQNRREEDARRQHRQYPDQHGNFNDFKSRWDEPAPSLDNFRDSSWNERRNYRAENRYPENPINYYERWYENRYNEHQGPMNYRQLSETDYPDHQKANDRWQQDDSLKYEAEMRRQRNRELRDREEFRRRG